MKKLLIYFILGLSLLIGNTFGEIDINIQEQSVIEVNITEDKECSSYKIIVEKDGNEYIYDCYIGKTNLPLQMGNGKYTITLLKSNDDRRYKNILQKIINIDTNKNNIYLTSIQNINWEESFIIKTVAKTLTLKDSTDEEKVKSIYNFIIRYMNYDYNKANTIKKNYIPKPEEILLEGQGICYDYASIMASLLRSINIPTKLIKGYSNYVSGYHAWNEVLINDEWIIIDATTDSILLNFGIYYEMKKNPKDYKTIKNY